MKRTTVESIKAYARFLMIGPPAGAVFSIVLKAVFAAAREQVIGKDIFIYIYAGIGSLAIGAVVYSICQTRLEKISGGAAMPKEE